MRTARETVTVESVTIHITGKTQHSPAEVRECAKLIAEVLGTLRMDGIHSVIACAMNFQGSKNLLGLSVQGVKNNAIVFAYQPEGNGTRMKYLFHTRPGGVNDLFESLKAVVGTAYLGREVSKEKLSPPVLTLVVPDVKKSSVDQSVAKLTEAPKVYYTSDPEWMETFILYLLELSDKRPDGHVSKNEVLDLICQHTHYKTRFGVGPVYNKLRTGGYLVEVEGQTDVFLVVGSPNPSFRLKRPAVVVKNAKVKVSKKPKVHKRGPYSKRSYLSDEEWMLSFMDGLRDLVNTTDGLISKTNLLRFIRERTNQKKIAGVVYRIVEGLEVRGWVISAGEKRYRVVYEPRPDTFEKAVVEIGRARADVAKVFEGFAKVRLPAFAEGLFTNHQILDEFLGLLKDGTVPSLTLQNYIERMYPGSYRSSCFQLFAYLVAHGYLLRLKMGTYALGPKGRERLGFPEVEYKFVGEDASREASSAQSATLATPSHERASVPAMQAFFSENLPASGITVTPPDVQSPAISPATLALAKLTREGLLLEPQIEAVEERVTALRRRKAAAEAVIAAKPNIDQRVQELLLAEINKF